MNKKFLAASIMGGTLAFMANTAWSQQTPGASSQSQREQTQPWQAEPSRPGSSAGVPATPGEIQELSKNDMQAVQQVLKDKGYDVSVNGTADASTRAAIRKFQQDEGLPVTGIIDERTANQLGFQVRSRAPADQPGAADYPGSPGSGTQPGSKGLPGSAGQPDSADEPSKPRY